jgi:hypothetical protein
LAEGGAARLMAVAATALPVVCRKVRRLRDGVIMVMMQVNVREAIASVPSGV